MSDFDVMPGDEEFFVDFTDVQAKTFDPVPAGWYLYEVRGYDRTATKKDGKKMKAGTPGLNFDFIVVEPEKYLGRHVFQNFWMDKDQVGFMKAMMLQMECYAPGEIDAPLTRELVDKMVGAKIWGRTVEKPAQGQYGASNQIQSWRKESDPPVGGSNEGGATSASMLP